MCFLLNKKCPHSDECRSYRDMAPSCNEDHREGYCGIDRDWDSYQYEDYGINPNKK